MTLGIICAMAEEIALLREDIASRTVTEIGMREYISGTLYGHQVVLVMSRIGKVAAASTATILIDRFHVDRILFTGTAGGINPVLTAGDIVIGDQSIHHDFFIHEGNRFTVPMIEKDYFDSDREFSNLACEAAETYVKQILHDEVSSPVLQSFHITEPRVVRGTVASGDQFICDSEKKQWLRDNLRNLQCVEMEGAAVAQICYEYGVPFVLMRVISDCADEASPINFEEFIASIACYFTRGVIRSLLEKV